MCLKKILKNGIFSINTRNCCYWLYSNFAFETNFTIPLHVSTYILITYIWWWAVSLSVWKTTFPSSKPVALSTDSLSDWSQESCRPAQILMLIKVELKHIGNFKTFFTPKFSRGLNNFRYNCCRDANSYRDYCKLFFSNQSPGRKFQRYEC